MMRLVVGTGRAASSSSWTCAAATGILPLTRKASAGPCALACRSTASRGASMTAIASVAGRQEAGHSSSSSHAGSGPNRLSRCPGLPLPRKPVPPPHLLGNAISSRSINNFRAPYLTVCSTTESRLNLSSARSFSTAAQTKKAIMTVTGRAADRVNELMQVDPACQGIRISLRQRGCSGMSYVMDFQKEQPGKFDEVIEVSDGAKVIVDGKAVLFLVGTEMDYVEVEMGSEFIFNNPNEKSSCGCGQSFNV